MTCLKLAMRTHNYAYCISGTRDVTMCTGAVARTLSKVSSIYIIIPIPVTLILRESYLVVTLEREVTI